MNGVSKLIMDPPAFRKLVNYYTSELESDIKKSGVFAEFFNKSKIGMAFRSMITPEGFRSVRENAFRQKARQIFAISFKNDRVIPAKAIQSTVKLEKETQYEMLDVAYPYRHELPFPLKMEEFKDKINDAFERVFLKAGVFLS